MRSRIILLLLLLCLPMLAQRHVRGVHPRHEKVTQQDEAHMDTTGLLVLADKAWAGIDLPQAFTGQGVMVGMTDIGFDFTHPNYATTRITRFWDMVSRDTLQSLTPVFIGRDYDEQELRRLGRSYDALEQTHGTHTMACAVGGDAKYRGIAPDAEVVVVGNVLSNNAWQVDSLQQPKLEERNYKFDEFAYMFDYAAQRGMPCVINMSAGSRQSFGDDFDVYNAKIDSLVGPGRIIVASAGNNGQQLTTLHKPAGKPRVGTRAYIRGSEWCYMFFQTDGDAQCRMWYSNDEGRTKQPLPDDAYMRIDTISDYDGRAVQYLFFEYKKTDKMGYKWLYVTLEGEGEAILYTQGTLFINSEQDDGFNDAERSYGVNFPSAYDNVICVGNTQHRNEHTNYLGQPIDWHVHVPSGTICPFSSTGPRLDGYQKPDICAPGCFITGSVSSFAEEAHPDQRAINDDVERFQVDGRTYAWRTDCGTSLSAPVVTGVIALWLQANPQLTPQDIKEIFRRTARHPDPSLTYPNPIYGYGEIDAYAGLLDVLGMTSIEGLPTYQPRNVQIALEGRTLLLNFAQEEGPVDVRLYNTAGQQVHTARVERGEGVQRIPLPSLPSGIYAVQLRGTSCDGSSLIRIL